jgi:cytosine/adenosine deaminase-related metal-dependent hydrolase
MIVRAKVVVTMDRPPIENGAVVVSGDRIADVGRFAEIAKTHSGEEIADLGDQALLPGLINAHCHLDYTCLRGKIPRQKSFTDWIRAINAAKAKLSPADYVRSINEGFAEAKRFGTTTIANLTAFSELVSQIKAPIRTWWFAELIDVRDPTRANDVVDLAVQNLKSQEHWGLAPHAPFTASADLYRRSEEIAEGEDILLTTHLAESREEMSMFRDGKGELYEFLNDVGRDMSDCGRETAIQRFVGRLGEASLPGWLLVHINEISNEDLDTLKKSAGKDSIVHCPRSYQYFGHSSFQFQKLHELRFNVCLGTDSLASNEDLSLFAEMRAFQKEFPHVSAHQMLEMVTTNAARALRQENALGKIGTGFLADLIAIPITRSTTTIEEIVAFDQPVSWSMLGGRVLA